ncbi:MAG TPA: NUDIX domain-containing protein [Verrucomicrobiae bacterium]|nr:NUDIX domain-containing protein [Verrucomicrobiae bacterium]
MAAFTHIFVVDEQGKPVGLFPKEEVWAKGLLHRIVRVMAEDSQGRILLQKRSPHMDLFPNTWDHSAAGHVDEGETYQQAAQRETEEEIGVKNAVLEEIASWSTYDVVNGRILNRLNKLYRARLDAPSLDLEEAEVSEVRWFTLAEISRLIREHPDQVTPGLIQVMQDYYSLV